MTHDPSGPAGPPLSSGEWRVRRDLLREAALQAEYATGRQEATEEAARRHVVVRVATVIAGFVVLLAGLVMMVLPGPGIVAILAGLGLLARELTWAERVLEYVKDRASEASEAAGLDKLKEQPLWVRATAITIGVIAAVGIGLYAYLNWL